MRGKEGNNKTYKIARDYWAADTAAMDAMTAGRSLNKLDPDQLAADLKVMSKSEKEAFQCFDVVSPCVLPNKLFIISIIIMQS